MNNLGIAFGAIFLYYPARFIGAASRVAVHAFRKGWKYAEEEFPG